MPDDWSQLEVELIVADYFVMLRAELMGEPYSKAEHRRNLIPHLRGRSNPSVEYKYANISAVLVQRGMPYIDGYKPRGNYQSLLADAVEDYVARQGVLLEQLAEAQRLNPTGAPVLGDLGVGGLFVPPPERIVVTPQTGEPWLSRRGRHIDFARRDAENRRMSKLGEQFVVEVERKRLQEAGRDDLAARVEWVARTCGDGLGFDVLSFNEADESERMVEVKTTGLGRFFPFYVTANELRCSEAVPEKFRLYRVFDFSQKARVYVLPGALSQACTLEPVQYRARI